MTGLKLTFKTLTLWYNPETFTITASRSLFRRSAPGLGEIVGETSVLAREVRGQGELFGDDAFERYVRLYREFLSGGEGLLQLPGLSPFPAFFTSLSLTGRAGSNSLSYAFAFCEKPKLHESAECETSAEFGFLQEGDSLWDIAARYSMSVEQLQALNGTLSDIQARGRVKLR